MDGTIDVILIGIGIIIVLTFITFIISIMVD